MSTTDEILVFNTKSCPGLQVFNSSDSLKYFTKETLLGTPSSDQYYDSLVFSKLHHLVNEPETLFYLMSVCPEEEVVDACRDCWQHCEQFSVSVYQVARVFLNWGASPNMLGIFYDENLSSKLLELHRQSNFLAPTSLPNFPVAHNVKAVLDVISECPPAVHSDDGDGGRYILIKVLMIASLDERMRPHRFKFHQAICQVLETFSEWNESKVAALVDHLQLMGSGLQNAVFLCCSLFTYSTRVRDFKVMAVRHLLHSIYGFLPPLHPFQSLLRNLPPPEQILERYKFVELYVLVQLLNTLLITCSCRGSSPRDRQTPDVQLAEISSSIALIETLKAWASSLHSALMAPKFMYQGECVSIKEKCTRLKADCVELTSTLKNHAKELQNDDE